MKKMSLLIAFVMISSFIVAQTTPNYKWLHPQPFGQGAAWIKAFSPTLLYAVGQNGTFLKSTDGGVNWSLNTYAGKPNATFTTNDLYGAYFFDQNIGYACGVLGVTKTTDAGLSWNSVGNISSGTARRIQFVNSNVGFVVGTSTIKMSATSDAGQTWTISATLPSATYYALQAFNTNRVIVGSSTSSAANIRLTTDGGLTWTAAAAGTGTIYSLAFSDSLTGYAGSGSGAAYKTTDGGITWAAITTGAPATAALYDCFINGTSVCFVGDYSNLYATTDGGTTFSAKTFKGSAQPWNNIMRGGTGSGSSLFVMGDNGYFFRSSDNGATWSSNSLFAKSSFLQDIWADASGRIIATGSPSVGGPNSNGEQAVLSTNYGKTWAPISLSNSTEDLRGLAMLNSTTGWSCGSGGKIYKTTNGGANWDSIFTTSIQALSDIKFFNSQYGLTAGNGGSIWKTTNGGATWLSISVPGVTSGFNSVEMTDTNTIFVLGNASGGFFKSIDGGVNWIMMNTGSVTSAMSTIKMLDKNNGYIIGATGFFGVGVMMKTTDGGTTWTDINFPFTTTRLYNGAFRTINDFIIPGSEGNVFHTTNGGSTWNCMNFGIRVGLNGQVLGANFFSADSAVITGAGAYILKIAFPSIVPVELSSFIASVNGNSVTMNWSTASEKNNSGFEIERSRDRSTWSNISFISGKGTSTEINKYTYTDKNLKAATYYYRLRQIDYDGTINYYPLGSEMSIATPSNFELSQNFPNPFNPSTSIRFSIPKVAKVKLELFDAIGQLISTLVNETKEAGSYDIQFDATKLTSGVYIYKLTAGENSSVKKMTLMK